MLRQEHTPWSVPGEVVCGVGVGCASEGEGDAHGVITDLPDSFNAVGWACASRRNTHHDIAVVVGGPGSELARKGPEKGCRQRRLQFMPMAVGGPVRELTVCALETREFLFDS